MMITAAGVHDAGDDAIQIYVERRWLLHEEGHRGAGKLVLARSMPKFHAQVPLLPIIKAKFS